MTDQLREALTAILADVQAATRPGVDPATFIHSIERRVREALASLDTLAKGSPDGN